MQLSNFNNPHVVNNKPQWPGFVFNFSNVNFEFSFWPLIGQGLFGLVSELCRYKAFPDETIVYFKFNVFYVHCLTRKCLNSII